MMCFSFLQGRSGRGFSERWLRSTSRDTENVGIFIRQPDALGRVAEQVEVISKELPGDAGDGYIPNVSCSIPCEYSIRKI